MLSLLPNSRSSLFPLLLSSVTATDRLLSLRSSYTLHCVIKTLQAKRTPNAKATFVQLTATALPVVAEVAAQHARRLCQLLQQSSGRITDQLTQELVYHSRMTALQAKCLTRLIAYGVSDVSQSTGQTHHTLPFSSSRSRTSCSLE